MGVKHMTEKPIHTEEEILKQKKKIFNKLWKGIERGQNKSFL
jgi:hypothetical protein